MKRFIHYSRWYYQHASTWLPVWTLEDGTRAYPEQYSDRGEEVCIRPATAAEHDAMCERFDRVTDEMAAGMGSTSAFVDGLGNFELGSLAPEVVVKAVADLKARARTEPRL